MAFADFLPTALLGNPVASSVIGTVIVLLILFLLFWLISQNRSLSYGSRRERFTFKQLRFVMAGIAMTGFGAYKLLKWGIKSYSVEKTNAGDGARTRNFRRDKPVL